MTSNETLSTPADIIHFDQSTEKSVAQERCAFIVDVEEELFNKCFGYDFYILLLNNKYKFVEKDCCIGQDNCYEYVCYDRNKSYVVGDVVMHEGCFYQVIKDTNATQPISSKKYFKPIPKFSNDKFEFLWQRYLGRLIAFSVTNTSVMYRLIKDTPKGLVKQYDEGNSSSASLKEVMALKQEAAFDIDRIKTNMDLFINRNASSFAGYKGLDTGCEGECETLFAGTRKLGFNV